MPKISRTKGVRWERKVASIFREWGIDATRTFGQYRDGAEAPDVKTKHLWIECKCGKTMLYKKAIEQAIEDSKESGLIPIAVCKKDNCTPLVVLTLEDFLKISDGYK